ncbi:MAG: ATP-binding protein [Hyphomonadaceae bacterium]
MAVSSTLRVRPGQSEALDILMEAVERLAAADDELNVAAIVRTAARQLTGADGVSVVLRKGDRVHYVDEDAVGPLWKGQDFPIDACISGWAIKNKQTVVIADISGDPRIPLAAYEPTFVKSLAMAPVGLPNPIAAIGAYWGEMRRPTDDEVQALETMARAAAVALENTRLRRELSAALADARAADAAKSAFLATMSREIRTPLNGVAIMADLLRRTRLDERQEQICKVLKTSTEDVVQLVCDILDFAKLESGRADFYSTRFDFAATVREAAQSYIEQAAQRGLTFEMIFADEALGHFMGDDLRVKQIVQHLAANAVKFTEAGGVTIRVEQEDRVGVRSMFKISVTDTGLGFDESTAGALFERFAQGEHSRSGAGLGLALAEAIAHGLGGDISASAKSGVGSTFVVRLPLERSPEDFLASGLTSKSA